MTEKEINKTLFIVSQYLLEAATHLRGIDVFEEEAFVLINMADQFSQLITPDIDKVSEDRMLEILNEIASIGGESK